MSVLHVAETPPVHASLQQWVAHVPPLESMPSSQAFAPSQVTVQLDARQSTEPAGAFPVRHAFAPMQRTSHFAAEPQSTPSS